jgi:hypothetical protein
VEASFASVGVSKMGAVGTGFTCLGLSLEGGLTTRGGLASRTALEGLAAGVSPKWVIVTAGEFESLSGFLGLMEAVGSDGEDELSSLITIGVAGCDVGFDGLGAAAALGWESAGASEGVGGAGDEGVGAASGAGGGGKLAADFLVTLTGVEPSPLPAWPQLIQKVSPWIVTISSEPQFWHFIP